MSLAQDFSSLLGPAVSEIDRAITSVQASQESLGKEIDRMIAGKINKNKSTRI